MSRLLFLFLLIFSYGTSYANETIEAMPPKAYYFDGNADHKPLYVSGGMGAYGAALGQAVITTITVGAILGGTIGGIVGYNISQDAGTVTAGTLIGIVSGGLLSFGILVAILGSDTGLYQPEYTYTYLEEQVPQPRSVSHVYENADCAHLPYERPPISLAYNYSL